MMFTSKINTLLTILLVFLWLFSSPLHALGHHHDHDHDHVSGSDSLFQNAENYLNPQVSSSANQHHLSDNEPIPGVVEKNLNTEENHSTSRDGLDTTTSVTELTPDPVRSLLLVSTLDGSLTALDRLSGQLRWVSKDEPMIRVPTAGKIDSLPKPPFFLPDPRSGSLYVLGHHGRLKKLPFTIPQLVSMAPCRSTEGLLYTGRKMDVWLSLNPITGEKSEMRTNDDLTCPLATDRGDGKSSSVLIGKSEYTISMLDGPRKWNVTFHDYSSVDMTSQSREDYELVHFTSPSTGTILTYERESGQLLWQADLQSPVIALYTIDCSLKSLVSVPFTAVGSETLNRIKTPAAARDNSQLLPTLYIGECPFGLYAVPSLVDDTVSTISSSNFERPPLIEGPNEKSNSSESHSGTVHNSSSEPVDESGDFLLLGHYEVPETPKNVPMRIGPGSQESETAGNNGPYSPTSTPNETDTDRRIPAKHPFIFGGSLNTFPPLPHDKEGKSKSSKNQATETDDRPSFVVFTTAVITILATSTIFVAVRVWSNYRYPNRVKKPFLSGSDGIISVGKISFDPSSVLGKGCEGTFVFKGKFENRSVAVKRILPECFAFADREVALLKESDEHPNVVRYYCTEEDMQFRYIALELCAATLHDWIEGRFTHEKISSLTVLKEATDGLAYLHSLRIVHRDIKPANVLLTVGPTADTVKAMISDFGLCKKLMNGRVSFSRRSGGIPGTEGWIAPELMREENSTEEQRTTHAVDIFSLGCVFYYVLSKGCHPFGDAFQRQSNIISGEFDLNKIREADDRVGIHDLISAMISSEADLRPPPSAILSHPMFWSQEKILSFFLDVSDRIEKENEISCVLLRSLETGVNKEEVVKQDWRNHICPEVAMDLRRYRTYRGSSVRDLLRALRNKKNHYRELTPEAQASLGEIPNQFVNYWISRFPSLLPYTWSKFERVKSEPIFSKYYADAFNFFARQHENTPEILSRDPAESQQQSNVVLGPPPGFDPIGTEFPTPIQGSPDRGDVPRQIITKNFWKSRNQQNYNYRNNNKRRGAHTSGSSHNFPPNSSSPNISGNFQDLQLQNRPPLAVSRNNGNANSSVSVGSADTNENWRDRAN